MEIKINREIRDFGDSLFFGLNARQLICSAAAIVLSCVLFVSLKPRVGTEAASWACLAAAAPFGLLGFLKYHGMKFEQLAKKMVRTFLLSGRVLIYKGGKE